MTRRPLILLVEDEWFLQADAVQTLERAGFEADAVFSGEKALTHFESGRRYDALITDARLGDGLTGWEVARRIREKDRTFPVIYLTGSAVEEWSAERVPESILICKPFVPARLVTALSRLLASRIEEASESKQA